MTLGIVYGYTVFLDGAKFGVKMRNRHKVLETGSILELLYEYGEKMRDLCSSAWWVGRGVLSNKVSLKRKVRAPQCLERRFDEYLRLQKKE